MEYMLLTGMNDGRTIYGTAEMVAAKEGRVSKDRRGRKDGRGEKVVVHKGQADRCRIPRNSALQPLSSQRPGCVHKQSRLSNNTKALTAVAAMEAALNRSVTT